MADCPFCTISRRGLMAKAFGGALALGVAGHLAGITPARAQAQTGLVSEQLAEGHTEYSEFVGGPADFYTLKITFDPGTVIDWHMHPGPVFAMITAGTLTNPYDLTGCKASFGTGSAVYVPGGTIHQDRNDGADQLVVFSTFIVPAGSALRVPEAAPASSTCGQSVQAPAS